MTKTLTEEDARNGVKHRPLTEGKMRSQVKPEFTGKRPSAPPPQGQPQTAPKGWRDNAGDPPVEVIDILPMSEREKQWREFSDTVAKHLREYTVPQYGDVGEDAITDYSAQDCITQVEKYAKRFGTQSRDGQQELDFLKIAHYVQCAWEKYEPESFENGAVGIELFFSYGMDEDNHLAANGYKFIGSGLDKNGSEVHIFRKGER